MTTDEAVRSVIPEDVLRNLRRLRKVRDDDGRCSCGRFPAVCSPMGRPCYDGGRR